MVSLKTPMTLHKTRDNLTSREETSMFSKYFTFSDKWNNLHLLFCRRILSVLIHKTAPTDEKLIVFWLPTILFLEHLSRQMWLWMVKHAPNRTEKTPTLNYTGHDQNDKSHCPFLLGGLSRIRFPCILYWMIKSHCPFLLGGLSRIRFPCKLYFHYN